MEQHTGLMLQSHWHSVGLTLGCPHLASVMGTPSNQYVQLTHTLCVSSSYHPYAFFAIFVFVQFFIIFWLICCCFFLTPPSFLHITCMCVCICFVKLEDSTWTDHCAPFFSLSLWKAPTQLEPRRLKRGAWERRNKGPSVCSHRHSAPPTAHPPPPFFPPLVPSPLFPLPTGHRPKLRLQTRKWAH